MTLQWTISDGMSLLSVLVLVHDYITLIVLLLITKCIFRDVSVVMLISGFPPSCLAILSSFIIPGGFLSSSLFLSFLG